MMSGPLYSWVCNVLELCVCSRILFITLRSSLNLNFQLSENLDTLLAIEIQVLHNDEIQSEWKQLVQHTLLLQTRGQMSNGEEWGGWAGA